MQQFCDFLQEDAPKNRKKKIAQIIDHSTQICDLHDCIVDYLTQMFSGGKLTEEQASQTAGLMCVLGDLDRINRQCQEIAMIMQLTLEEKKYYTKPALEDLRNALQLFSEIYGLVLGTMRGEEMKSTDLSEKREVLLDLDIDMRLGHMNRVAAGTCDATLTASFGQIIHGISRIGVSCINIAEAIRGKVDVRALLAEEQVESSAELEEPAAVMA